MSKHHPEVRAAHIFNGNRHLEGGGEKSGELKKRSVNTGLYMEEKLSGKIICMSSTFCTGIFLRRLFHYTKPHKIHLKN